MPFTMGVLDYLMDRGSGHAVMEEARGVFSHVEELNSSPFRLGNERGVGLGDRPSDTCSTADLNFYVAASYAYACLYLPSAR